MTVPRFVRMLCPIGDGGSLAAAVKEDAVDAVGGDILRLAALGVSVEGQVDVAGFGKGGNIEGVRMQS